MSSIVLERIGVATEQQVGARELGGEADVLGRLEQIPVFVTGRLQQRRPIPRCDRRS